METLSAASFVPGSSPLTRRSRRPSLVGAPRREDGGDGRDEFPSRPALAAAAMALLGNYAFGLGDENDDDDDGDDYSIFRDLDLEQKLESRPY